MRGRRLLQHPPAPCPLTCLEAANIMQYYHVLVTGAFLFCTGCARYGTEGHDGISPDGGMGGGGSGGDSRDANAPPTPICENCDDGNDCTDDTCTIGGCVSTPKAHGSPCIGGVCSVDNTPGDERGMCCDPGSCVFVARGDAGQVSMHCVGHCPDGMKCGSDTGVCETDP